MAGAEICFVMDNASFDHPKKIKRVRPQAMVLRIYLLSNSLDLNPIEEPFAKLKASSNVNGKLMLTTIRPRI
jgi:transposase